MIGQVFTVLTEFKFEVGEAVLQTNALTGATDKLSMSAQNAMASMQYASASIVQSFIGGPGGGILGVLYTAISSADKFANSQISLANTLATPGETFASAMERANESMENIGKVSRQFSLPADELMNITKLLGPMLNNHGAAGNNYSNAIQLGRRYLKATPMLGVDSSMAQGELQSMLSGHASNQERLYQRLTGETKAMQPYAGNTASFNALDFKKRLEIITKALDQFAGNTVAVTAAAHTMSGELRLLKTNLVGAFSVLKDIGTVILKPVLQVLTAVNKYLETNGKKISANVARMIDPWVSDTQSFMATLYQMKNLKHDIATTGHLFGVIGTLLFAGEILHWLGIEIPFVTAALKGLATSVEFFTGAMSGLSLAGPTGGILGFIDGFIVVLSDLLVPIALVVGALTFLSRAFGYAYQFGMATLMKHMPEITETFANLSGLLGVFMEGFDRLARLLGEFLNPLTILGYDIVPFLVGSLEFLIDVTAMAVMGFEGLALAVMEFFVQIKSFLTGGGFDKSAIAEAFDYGMQDVYEKVYGKLKEPGAGGVQNQVVNMDVKMENHFKELMEPDRVAFTIKDQLLKASQNKTTATRQGFSLTGAKAGGG